MSKDWKNIDKLAKKLWDYNHMSHKLQKADVIVCLGSHDVRVAEHASKLYLDGWAPLLVFSGGAAHQGDLLDTGWNKAEAEVFSDIAIRLGVPKKDILIEDKSQNTGENVAFTKKLLKKRNKKFKKLIIVQKPYMERRAYATFKKLLPDIKVITTSPAINYEEYPNERISKDRFINILVGDTQRVRLYAQKGFQIEQEFPNSVWTAYNELVKLGYSKHLVR